MRSRYAWHTALLIPHGREISDAKWGLRAKKTPPRKIGRGFGLGIMLDWGRMYNYAQKSIKLFFGRSSADGAYVETRGRRCESHFGVWGSIQRMLVGRDT